MDSILKAQFILSSVKGKSLSLNTRRELSIALASSLLAASQALETKKEKKKRALLAAMMDDPLGKPFATAIADQCFRSKKRKRIADQLSYVLKHFGVPDYFPIIARMGLKGLSVFGKNLGQLAVPFFLRAMRKEMSTVILPGDETALKKHMKMRKSEGIRVNLNHLGEAILSEEEAHRRLNLYLKDLQKEEVEVISIKISTLYSQINLIAWEESLDVLSKRLKKLYRMAKKNSFIKKDGTSKYKFVNLDMEEYRDLHLTVTVFKKVLDDEEFLDLEAGIVLQSYLPDSYIIQLELTDWALQRIAKGGAPIKIRLVKGANLAMEQIDSALHQWPQAPYLTKEETDANFKRMIQYGCIKKHVHAVHLGIGSHNLFDIAFTLLLRSENEIEQEVCFEMLEGMAEPIQRVILSITGDLLLYCPAAKKDEFQNAVAYLVRRLDENTAPENFLRHLFYLHPGTAVWDEQVRRFSEACLSMEKVSYLPKREQNRFTEYLMKENVYSFSNEPDTDWSLPQNRTWAKIILDKWRNREPSFIPLMIGGNEIQETRKLGIGVDPSFPDQVLYRYQLADLEDIDKVIEAANSAPKISWEKRTHILKNISEALKIHRADLIGAMMADTGKTMQEADVEVSEAIDFANYYRANLEEWHQMKEIQWKEKGTVLVTPPWNFPCSIPSGGILAAFATGNSVIFKPAPESILVGWTLAQILWGAGVGKELLQFLMCEDDPAGSQLIQDQRISSVVLTGSTETAKLFLKLRPSLDLIAETGGKNIMLITGMSDRDLAIKDLLSSAFGHAGQKCSACSLAILEAEVYDDEHFLQQLCEAASSLSVGSQWEMKTKVNPLIRAPNQTLLRGLTECEAGEKWLLKPRQDPHCPNLWSPGIKLGVQPSSFTFQNELFGPVLGLVRAENFKDALSMVNQTPYGLTAGIHSLDQREQEAWLATVDAGNCYINRTMTGAIVRRQPFGGCKESNFGKGAKAGGPNYLLQLMNASEIALPSESYALNLETAVQGDKVMQDLELESLTIGGEHSQKVKAPPIVSDYGSKDCVNLSPSTAVSRLNTSIEKISKKVEAWEGCNRALWRASIQSYAFYWSEFFSKAHDPSLILGQDNLQTYRPHPRMIFRVQKGDSLFDVFRVMAAAFTCRSKMEISVEEDSLVQHLQKMEFHTLFNIRCENDESLIEYLKNTGIRRMRFISDIKEPFLKILAEMACHLNRGAVLANGRLELLHYLREVTISRDVHRYGNLTYPPLPMVGEGSTRPP